MAPGELEEANDVPPETHANSVNGVSREFSNSFEPASVPSAAPTAPNKSPLSGQSTNKARVHPFQPEAGEDTKKTGIIAPLKVHIAASGSQLEGAVPNQSASVFDQLERRKHNSRAPWRVRVGDFMDGIPFTIVTILFTMLILYTDLIRQAATTASADKYFLAWTIFAIVAIFAEVFFSALCRPGYFPKFYFWMDLVASFSLLCDIPGFTSTISFDTSDDNRSITLERGAKNLQAAARSARIMQVIAAVQLLRIKAKQRLRSVSGRFSLAEDGLSTSSSTLEDEGGSSIKTIPTAKPQTRLGEKVTEMTQRKVILGVLALLLVLPVFDPWLFYGKPTSLEKGGLVLLHDLYQEQGNSTGFQLALQTYIDENIFKAGGRNTGFVYRLKIWNATVMDADPVLRKDERQVAVARTPECDNGPWERCFESKAWVDVRWEIQLQALLDIGRVTFILCMLCLGAVLFIRDTEELVLRPIERMVNRVKTVSRNPLAAQSMALGKSNGKGSQKQLETRILENSIGKICSLLSVGFGEAGAEVIADNIRSGGDLNPMVPGRRVRAIFGFCDIRNFTDTTEVLQEGIMEFVNSISSIVHSEVALHGGAANKNIGDAFLLVWKLPRSAGEVGDRAKRSSIIGARRAAAAGNNASGANQREEVVTHLADAALASFIVVQAALKRSRKLQEYSERADLNARMPGFEVRMGFGLHVGWAIEGAIGSHYKIDASYLSPHVNLAARLEAATKQFGVTLLLSDEFVAMLSGPVRRRCRQIDCVTVKGSICPIGLYTYDIDPTASDADRSAIDALNIGATEPVGPTVPGHVAATAAHTTFSDYPYYDEYEEHPDIVATRFEDAAFHERFAEGFEAYKNGEWGKAIAVLETTLDMRRDAQGNVVRDGPSEALLSYMQGLGGNAPQGWAGYRELTEK